MGIAAGGYSKSLISSFLQSRRVATCLLRTLVGNNYGGTRLKRKLPVVGECLAQPTFTLVFYPVHVTTDVLSEASCQSVVIAPVASVEL